MSKEIKNTDNCTNQEEPVSSFEIVKAIFALIIGLGSSLFFGAVGVIALTQFVRSILGF